MTTFRTLAPPLTLWASSPRALRFVLASNGVAQDLTGRSFVLVVRRAAILEPLLQIAGVLSSDGQVYMFLLTAEDCTAVYDASSYALVYEVIETTHGGSTTRWTGPIDAQPSSSLPSGEIAPAVLDVTAADILAETDDIVVSELGATGPGVEQRFAQKGLIPSADTDLMIGKIKEWGGEGGAPFAGAAQDAAQLAQEKAASATDDRLRAEQAAASADNLRDQVAAIAAGASADGTYLTEAVAQNDPTLPVGANYWLARASSLDLYSKGAGASVFLNFSMPNANAVADVKGRTGRRIPKIGRLSGRIVAANGGFYTEATPRAYNIPKIGGGAKAYSAGRAIQIEDPIEQRFGKTDDMLTGVPITLPTHGDMTTEVRPQIFLPRTAAVKTPLTGGPYPATLRSGGNGLAFIRRRGADARVRYRPVTLHANSGLQMIFRLGWGQSLRQGYAESNAARTGPTWRDKISDRAWQFDGRAIDGHERGPRPLQLIPEAVNRFNVVDPVQFQRLAPLRGASHMNSRVFAQTDMESCAQALIGQHMHPLSHFLGCIIGTGGTAIADFAPGSAHYTSMLAAIDAAARHAAIMGLTLNIVDDMSLGEADNGIGTSGETFKTYWRAINAGLRAKAAAVGANWIGSIIQQCEQRPGGNIGMATLAQADLIRNGEAVGMPIYPMLPGHDLDTHLLGPTYFPMGSGGAYLIARMIETAGTYRAPYLPDGSVALTSGTTSTVTFSGGTGSMTFDTKTIPDMLDGWKGASLASDAGAVPISAMTLSGATLQITHAPTTLDAHPRFLLGCVGGVNPPPDAAGARINIRDDSEWLCGVTGQIVSGWPVQQIVYHV